MADDIQIDKNARFAIAHGMHIVKGYKLAKRIELTGNNKEVYVRMGLGLDEWDACVGLYYNGNIIDPSDFVFHAGGPIDVADAFFPGETYPGAAYVNVRLRGAFAEDEDPENIEGVYRCLKIADYNGAGQQIDSLGNPIPVGATPRDYYFYSPSPARQMVDLIIRWGLRKATLINWEEWANWKADCAELINWNDGTEVRQIPRFESHLFFMPPFRLKSAMWKIAQVACAEWERANGKLYFLTPHARDPIFTFDLTKMPIGAFKTYPVSRDKKYNQVLVYFRDRDSPYLTPAGEDGAAPIVDIKRPLAASEVRKPLEINIGGAYASQAQRVGEYNARIHCDLDVVAEFEGSPDAYPVLPASIVQISGAIPTWDGVKFKVYEKEESEDTKLGYPMTALIYSEDAYSDTDHGPIERPLPPSDPDKFAPPPQVTSVTLAERNILQADQTVVTLIEVTAQFAPYVNKQKGRVLYKKSSEAWNQARDGGTIDPSPDTLRGSLEIRGVEKTTYDVKVVPESSFASAGSAGAVAYSILITGKVTLPAEPATHTAVYNSVSRKIAGSYPASTDGDVQAYLLYVEIGGIDTFVENLGNRRAYEYTPPSNWSGPITLKVFTLNWSGWTSASGRAAAPVSPPVIPNLYDFWVYSSGYGRENRYEFLIANDIDVLYYEVYKNLAGATQTYPPNPLEYAAANTRFSGGTPSGLIYRGRSREFFLSQDSPLNSDGCYARAVGYFGNVSQWTHADNYHVWNLYSTTGNEIAAPAISVDSIKSTPWAVVIHIATSNPVGSVTATRAQIRQKGDALWPSSADGTDGQEVLAGLHREVKIPWSKGGTVEIRVMFDGAPSSGWSNTLTHKTFGDLQLSTKLGTAELISSGRTEFYPISVPGADKRDVVIASPNDSPGLGIILGSARISDDAGNGIITLGNMGVASQIPSDVTWSIIVKKRRPVNPEHLPYLISHWRLDEASGTRYDVHGSNHLTDVNTVTQATGKIGSAAQFVAANGEYLSVANNSSLQTGDIYFLFKGWFRLASKTTSRVLLSKDDLGSNREFGLYYEAGGTDRIQFYVFSTAGAYVFVNANALGSPAINTWYFIACWHDPVLNTINIKINNGATDSANHAGGVRVANAPFILGAWGDGSFSHDGLMDAVSFYKGGLLTATQLSTQYNSANGLDYPF